MSREHSEKKTFPVVSGSNIALTLQQNTLVDIEFIGRPSLTLSQQKQFKGYEACHRVGVAIIKQEIKQKYIGSKLDEVTPDLDIRRLYSRKRHTREDKIEKLGKEIAKAWLDAFRNDGNIFTGNPIHNNFAGKLSLLLQPYFSLGKDKFDHKLKTGSYTIDIPLNCEKFGDKDFYKTVREELNANSIEISTWSDLCAWYFCANYDESPDTKKAQREKNFSMLIGKKKESQQQQTELTKRDTAMTRFKNAYNLHGLCADTTNKKETDDKDNEHPAKRTKEAIP